MIFNHCAKGFNGVVGMIERGEAQLAASLLVINAERMRAVNFSLPISFEPYTMMFRRPEELTRYLLFIGNVQLYFTSLQFCTLDGVSIIHLTIWSEHFYERTLSWAHAFMNASLIKRSFSERAPLWTHAFLSVRLYERTLFWAHAFLSARFFDHSLFSVRLFGHTLFWEHAYWAHAY